MAETTKKIRIWELDFFRGICMLGVILVHLFYDLVFFAEMTFHFPKIALIIADYGGILFIVLSGICVTLGSHSVKRGLIVFGAGLLISGVTFIMFGPSPDMIWFGILHLLGICMLLYSVLKKLSTALLARVGSAGLADDSITVNFTGIAGQSFGAFLAPGLTFNLAGEANDFVGKGLSGGIIAIKPPVHDGFAPEENVIAGNVIAYGATEGKIFLNGQAGERFGIRNSGATLVAEGVGDHGCEYMTGGTVAVLGPTGVNFGAGMTGGVAYVLDEAGDFDLRCNLASIDLATVEAGSDDETALCALLDEHVRRTGSPLAQRIRDNWCAYRPKFVKVAPTKEI